MSDLREFNEAVCHFCKKPAAWLVYEDRTARSDWMFVCEHHKTTAFS